MATELNGTIGDDIINDADQGTIKTSPFNPAESVTVTGLSGFDSIYGSTNADTLFGNAGNDLILGNGGSDKIYGGQGNDRLFVTGNKPTTTEPALSVRSLVVGGQGLDRIYVGGTTSARDNENGFSGDFVGQVTVFGGSESTDKEDQGDEITVNLAADSSAFIYGNGGNDRIALDGSDRGNAAQAASRYYVHGGQGNDNIYGFVGGASTVFGGVDADDIDVFAVNSVTVHGGNGESDAVDGNDDINVVLSNGAFTAAGTVPAALVTGNGGSDDISVFGFFTPVQASVYGGQGTDSIQAGFLASKSYIAGGLGSDVINVSLDGKSGANDVAAKDVTIVGGNGTTDPGDGTDIIQVKLGNESTAQIFGNGGDDLLRVQGPGSATVYGGAGDDTFFVDAENNDNNLLPQSVVLTGGAGSDLYQIEASGQTRQEGPIVRITDFNFDQDKIVGDEAGDLVFVTGNANTFNDLLDLADGPLDVNNAALITVQSGALAGTYLAYENDNGRQIVNVTGYTGTADADVFANPATFPV